MHLTYLGELDGSYEQSRITFHRDVAVVMGPITDWNQALDVDRINMPSLGQTKLETEELAIYSTRNRPSVLEMERRIPGSAKSAWELRAAGNVIIDANTEQGMMNLTADQGQYDALNEVLRFAGVPNRPARFKQYNGTQLDLLEGSFNLRTGESSMSMTNANGLLPPKYQTNQGSVGNVAPPAQGPQVIQSPRDFNVFQRP